MTVTIALLPEDEKKLAQLAAASGTDMAEYVRRLIKKEIAVPISISEAAELFARAIEASGISDEDFTSTLHKAQKEARQARKGQRSQGPA